MLLETQLDLIVYFACCCGLFFNLFKYSKMGRKKKVNRDGYKILLRRESAEFRAKPMRPDVGVCEKYTPRKDESVAAEILQLQQERVFCNHLI